MLCRIGHRGHDAEGPYALYHRSMARQCNTSRFLTRRVYFSSYIWMPREHILGLRQTKRREPSRPGPVERDVLARVGCPLELVAEGVDGANRRFAPGHDLSGSGFGT